MCILIAGAVEEQSTVTGEINRNVLEINTLSDDSARVFSEAVQASPVLSDHSPELYSYKISRSEFPQPDR